MKLCPICGEPGRLSTRGKRSKVYNEYCSDDCSNIGRGTRMKIQAHDGSVKCVCGSILKPTEYLCSDTCRLRVAFSVFGIDQ